MSGSPLIHFLKPNIGLSPEIGTVGNLSTVTGDGFVGGSEISVTYDSVPIAFDMCNRTEASFTATVKIPLSVAGPHLVVVRDAAGHYAHTTFTVIPEIILTPSSVTSDSEINYTGSGIVPIAQITTNSRGATKAKVNEKLRSFRNQIQSSFF